LRGTKCYVASGVARRGRLFLLGSVPASLFRMGVGRLGLPHLPSGAIDHLKYPIVVDSHPFQRATDYKYQHDERETIDAFREAG